MTTPDIQNPATLLEWVGCCDDVVDFLLAQGVVQGARQDGVWTGPVVVWCWRHNRWKRDSQGRPVHTWIALPDGDTFDALRWAFEGTWPYVYRGPADYYVESREAA